MDENRITAACELSLWTWLLLRQERSPRLSYSNPPNRLLGLLTKTVQKWKEFPAIREALSAGPIEAWSGELALSVPTFSEPERVCANTAANLHRVSLDRQLEWCWWCAQASGDEIWRVKTAEIAEELLRRMTASLGHCSQQDAYRLTHLVFYGTDFGRAGFAREAAEAERLKAKLRDILETHAENHDLTAEVLISLNCLGWEKAAEADLAVERLSRAQLAHGAFMDASEIGSYHTCLVLLLPVSGRES